MYVFSCIYKEANKNKLKITSKVQGSRDVAFLMREVLQDLLIRGKADPIMKTLFPVIAIECMVLDLDQEGLDYIINAQGNEEEMSMMFQEFLVELSKSFYDVDENREHLHEYFFNYEWPTSLNRESSFAFEQKEKGGISIKLEYHFKEGEAKPLPERLEMVNLLDSLQQQVEEAHQEEDLHKAYRGAVGTFQVDALKFVNRVQRWEPDFTKQQIIEQFLSQHKHSKALVTKLFDNENDNLNKNPTNASFDKLTQIHKDFSQFSYDFKLV